MSRILINARTVHDAATSEDVEVALFAIDHPSLDAPIRLSTDPTTRLSDDPLMYGTRSDWLGADPAADPYLFVLASTDLPSDLEDVPAAATIVLSNVDNRIADVLRSFSGRPTVSMAVIIVDGSWDSNLTDGSYDVEVAFHGLVITGSSGDAGEVRIEMSRAPIEDEMVPMDRFTKSRFPGLFR